MFQTNAKDNVELAEELYTLSQELRKLEKRKEQLREHFLMISETKNENIIKAGDYVITFQDASRENLDKTLIQEAFGIEFVQKYSKKISYKQMKVNK